MLSRCDIAILSCCHVDIVCLFVGKAADVEGNQERLEMRQRQLEEMAEALSGIKSENMVRCNRIRKCRSMIDS